MQIWTELKIFSVIIATHLCPWSARRELLIQTTMHSHPSVQLYLTHLAPMSLRQASDKLILFYMSLLMNRNIIYSISAYLNYRLQLGPPILVSPSNKPLIIVLQRLRNPDSLWLVRISLKLTTVIRLTSVYRMSGLVASLIKIIFLSE